MFGAVTIDNIDVLNDPNRLDQYLLERVDNGYIGARAVPSVEDSNVEMPFQVFPQKTYFGLVASVPAVKFKVLDAGKVTFDLGGRFMIGKDQVFEFGGTSTPIGGEGPTPVRDANGNFSTGVDGWFQFLPFRAKLYGAIKTSLYAQSRWGDLEKVAESADGTNGEFTFDPVYSGRLVLASFTIDGGKPQGYDFVNHRLLTTSEMTGYLRRFQGDVMLTTVQMGESSLMASVNYWVNEDTGENYATVPIYESDVTRMGNLEFALRLETFSDQGKSNPPEVLSVDVLRFDPTVQQWIGVEPVKVSTASTPKNYKATVRIANTGIYRFVPNVTGLIRASAKG